MRFIGSKAHLLKQIDAILEAHLTGNEETFVDLFAGSNIVAQHFKQHYQVTTNDLMYFSHAIARGSIALNKAPEFKQLKKLNIDDPFKFLQCADLTNYTGDFITETYSPTGIAGRMYFQNKNAKRIDYIRNTIDIWHKKNLINDDEFYYILNALIQAVPFVSNITGTYGAYLKHWDKRSFKSLELVPPALIDNHKKNTALRTDAVNLSKKISGDILYVDTPYNNRQYAPNYHVLETIALNDHPQVHGITGQRNTEETKSDFAMKRKALDAMKNLLSNLQFSHVVVSYSSEGIINEEEMLKIIESVAITGSVSETRIAYRKYKSKIVSDKDNLYELLFYFQPKHAKLIKVTKSSAKVPHKYNQNYTATGFIKSPLNYIGGKYKLLPQLLPLFPKKIDTFVDLFSGGGNVGINTNANVVYFNDINNRINELFRFLQGKDPIILLKNIYARIDEYGLSKTNESAFTKFRHDYNQHPKPLDLYILVAYSFNYQFRFNNNMEYNNPFGRNRSHFSTRMADHLVRFVTHLNEIDAHFTDLYFNKFNMENLTHDSFVYADPPYLITTGSYNDGNRGFVNWTKKQELELYSVLDKLNDRGIKFALSNVTDHKGLSNDLLKNWCKKYQTHVLNYGYQHASHNTVALSSREVLITNY